MLHLAQQWNSCVDGDRRLHRAMREELEKEPQEYRRPRETSVPRRPPTVAARCNLTAPPRSRPSRDPARETRPAQEIAMSFVLPSLSSAAGWLTSLSPTRILHSSALIAACWSLHICAPPMFWDRHQSSSCTDDKRRSTAITAAPARRQPLVKSSLSITRTRDVLLRRPHSAASQPASSGEIGGASPPRR